MSPQGPPPPPYGYAPPGHFGPFYPPPKPPPDPRRVMRIVRIVIFLLSLPCLGLVVAVAVDSYLDKSRDLVVFDNRLETPAEVFADGKSLKTLRPHQDYGAVVVIPKGAKHLEVRANGNVVSGVDLALTPAYRGLYVIGEPRDYVVAKVPYYEKEPSPPVHASRTPIPKPTPLAPLPGDMQSFEMHVDGVFLDSESVPGGTEVYWKRQICSADVGCRGYPR